MSKSIHTRISDEEFHQLESIAGREHLDKNTLIAKWIREKILDYKIAKSAEYYQKGIMSLAEAATQAGTTIYEMMDYLRIHQIKAPEESLADISKRHDEAKQIFDRMKGQ